MITDESLTESQKVRKLQNVLYAKAKAEPEFRFYALSDKMWRDDFLREAYCMVRRNGGSAGVDGKSFADIEAMGIECWLGELSQDLRHPAKGVCKIYAVRSASRRAVSMD